MMNKKIIFLSVIFIIFILGIILALEISNFTGYSTPENLTFTGSQNITRNITINRNANVTSGYLNLSGFSTRYTGESFSLSSGGNKGITQNGTFFWVVNSTDDKVYKYWMNGTYTGDNFDALGGGYSTQRPWGITQNGTYIWTTRYGAQGKVAKYWMNGTYIDSFGFSENLWGITQNGTFFWVRWGNSGTIFKLWMNGTYTGESFTSPAQYLSNNGTHIFGSYGNMILIYWMNGTYINNWSLSSGGNKGITQNGTFFWVVDSVDSKVYKYLMLDIYPTNPFISINNTQIWNHTGEFNSTFSPNQTDDFSSILNTALNEGACDCVGCTISGNNCTINFTFHSDTAGILEYSNLNITYENALINLTIPIEGYTYGTNESLELNFTYQNFTESNCYYNIKNSTGDYVVSNTSIANCQNTTFNVSQGDGNYNLTIYLNGTYGVMAQDSNTFSISINSPAINLIYPTNNTAFDSGNNIDFNFTAYDSDNVSTCILYEDFNGTWKQNETFTGIINNVQNHTILNLSEGNRIWTIWCNDTLGNGGYASVNNSLIIDLTDPIVLINSISTTEGTQTFSFSSTETDLNLDSCKYSIYNSTGGIDGLNENVSMSCNSNPHSATTTSYGNFTLRVYATDLAGNEDYDDLNFTTSASSGTIILGGGGGGTPTERIESDKFEITSINYLKSLDFSLAKDSVKTRSKNFYITNKGSLPITLNLVCDTTDLNEISTRNISICDYVEINQTTITISPNENDPYIGTIKVLTPENSSIGDEYYFNILAISTEESTEYYSKLSVSTRVSFLAYAYKWSYFFNTEKSYPVALISFLFALTVFITILIIFIKRKLELTGFLLGIFLFILIFFLGTIFL